MEIILKLIPERLLDGLGKPSKIPPRVTSGQSWRRNSGPYRVQEGRFRVPDSLFVTKYKKRILYPRMEGASQNELLWIFDEKFYQLFFLEKGNFSKNSFSKVTG
jgi:hypothetical protein